MGNCIYCGKKAGFLRKQHKACKLKFREAKKQFVELAVTGITQNESIKELAKNLENVCQQGFVNDEAKKQLLAEAFDRAMEQFLEDGVLSEKEEEAVSEFIEHFGLNQEILNKNGSYTKMVMASVIRELTERKIPQTRVKVEGQMPFLFQKSETLIWVFNNVEYYEQRTRTEYQGGCQGVSIKIAKGVYYRTSAFKGRPVQVSEMKYMGTGLVALTSKHLYFGTAQKKFRIAFNKLVSLEPYENGIGLHKDGVTAKPQIFKNLNGWFVHNVISNLMQM